MIGLLPSKDEFGAALAEKGWGLPDSGVERLHRHWALLSKWNARLNLTRIVDWRESVVRHYAESLEVGRAICVRSEGRIRVVDVGSGAGFPGIPISVYSDRLDVTVVESHQRKAVFLRECAREIGGFRVVVGRAEDLEGPFDWVVSRAVDPSFVASLLPTVAPRAAILMSKADLARVSRRDLVIEAIDGVGGKDRTLVLFHVEHPS